MINPSIFKAYDVRGIYPTDINEEVAYQVGRHFVEMLGVKEVVVGYDARVSGPSMVEALEQGIADAGATVIELGMTGTEVLYFAVGNNNFESGIMVTASHNPKEYNGLKLVRRGPQALSGTDGLNELRDRIINSPAERLNKEVVKKTFDPYQQMREKIFSLVDLPEGQKLKVVVDPGNGVGGILFDNIYGNHPNLEIHRMYYEPDGTFPNHESNPAKEENVEELKAKVKELNADLGIALDGDADRVFFIDETGGYIPGYYMNVLLGSKMLERNPGAKIFHECTYAWAIDDSIRNAGGETIEGKPGHSFIKAVMRSDPAIVFAGESSSHYFFKDMYYSDSSMLATGLLFEILLTTKQPLSQFISSLRTQYPISGEINFTVSDTAAVMTRVEEKYSRLEGVAVTKPDGIVLEKGREWRISVRSSNTEPLVRLNVEASNQEELAKVLAQAKELIY